MGIFDWLREHLRGSSPERPLTGLQQVASTSSRGQQRTPPRCPEIDVSTIQYASLPPSPDQWAERARRQSAADATSGSAEAGAITNAVRRGHYRKAVDLFTAIPCDERSRDEKIAVLPAFRKLMSRHETKFEWGAASRLASQLLAELADVATRRDYERHNRYARKLNEKVAATKHAELPIPPELSRATESMFEVDSAEGWVARDETELEPSERPDPAYDRFLVAGRQVIELDRLGRARKTDGAPSGLRLIDAFGTEKVTRALTHTMADASVCGRGSWLAVRDFGGSLHLYDDRLQSVWSLALGNRPEIGVRAKELDLDTADGRRLLRDAAVSPDGESVVFGAIDQAWCLRRDGSVQWGVQLPPKSGWTRVVERVSANGTAEDVLAALRAFDLKLPVTTEQIKRQYRELARRWHPDLNPAGPDTGERMREVNAAYEVLTGTDPSDLLREVRKEVVSYRDDSSYHRSHFDVEIEGVKLGYDISVGVYVSEAYARDWIANVAWSEDGRSIFVSSESGRIFQLTPRGQAQRVYDTSQVAVTIQEMAGYLYVATSTRLYMLRNGELLAVEDIFEQGRPVVTQEGVLLWDSKRITWIDKEGRRRGSVTANHPIRSVLCAENGWRVATRQHAVLIEGAPSWWPGAGDDHSA